VLFTGHSLNSIDAKHRLSIPAKVRAQWKEERDGAAWYCVPWPGGILRLYTEAAFTQHGWRAHSPEATLLIPAESGQSYSLELIAQPPTSFERPQAIRVFWNDVLVAKDFELPVRDRSTVAIDIPSSATRDGLNTVRLEMRDQRTFITRPTGDQKPGAGLTVNTWKPQTETLYLQGVKLVPVTQSNDDN